VRQVGYLQELNRDGKSTEHKITDYVTAVFFMEKVGSAKPFISFPNFINLLKPTGHMMHQQFNIQQLYALPTLYLCVLYLSENKQ
jgi:hypothetical protein